LFNRTFTDFIDFAGVIDEDVKEAAAAFELGCEFFLLSGK